MIVLTEQLAHSIVQCKLGHANGYSTELQTIMTGVSRPWRKTLPRQGFRALPRPGPTELL